MDTQNLLSRVKEVRKEYDIEQVNNLLKSGWILIELEQQIDNAGYTKTSYIMGRIEAEE